VVGEGEQSSGVAWGGGKVTSMCGGVRTNFALGGVRLGRRIVRRGWGVGRGFSNSGKTILRGGGRRGRGGRLLVLTKKKNRYGEEEGKISGVNFLTPNIGDRCGQIQREKDIALSSKKPQQFSGL